MDLPFRIGVVGHGLGTPFDEAAAQKALRRALDTIEGYLPGHTFEIVAGLTDVGMNRIAYREAESRGYLTTGIACAKANDLPIYDCDKKMLVGQEWGDESELFLDSIDALVRIGGGEQAREEARRVNERRMPLMEYELVKVTS